MKGILLIDKETGSTSFQIVHQLRTLLRTERTIGHAGTLDPFATGVMVMLIGKPFTSRANEFLTADKAYRATLTLGSATDTYDLTGQVTSNSSHIPTLSQVQLALQSFQGTILQIPPMYSAKKVGGKKLYDLARRGITIDRGSISVTLTTTLLDYAYPHLTLDITCSKGTYIRTLAHDLGHALTCYAHLSSLTRLRSGTFTLDQCIPQHLLQDPAFDISPHLLHP